MDTKVTISVRGLVVTAAVLLALVAAYVLGSAGHVGTPARAADDAADTSRRVLTLTGTGEATAVPDQLSFRLSVSAKNEDLETALATASQLMRHALAAAEKFGVTKDDMQTTGLQMNPEYRYHSYGPPELTGYRVTQTARVLVKQLGKAGKTISAIVASGGNRVRVTGIQLEVGDPDVVMAKARAAAVKEATAKAEQYAGATGQTLGDVMDLREVSAPNPRRDYLFNRYYSKAAALTDAALRVPIRAGEEELKVTVQIVWSFS
jgi:uncharacterized protein YggE